MKKLYLIRHAKSSWKDSTQADIDRPLNKRGMRDAPKMGDFLLQRGVQPDLILSSPAKRALKTAQIISEHLNYPVEDILQKKDIYLFDYEGEAITDILRQLRDEYETVMVFGHNPTFTALANHYSHQYFDNVPTCGVICIEFNTPTWENISADNSTMDFFMFPKFLKDNI